MNKSSPSRRSYEILHVEDNPADAYLVDEAFKEDPCIRTLHRARDGDQAIAFLRREGEYENAPRPDLVLLDLNLPGTSGREVLKAIKNDESLRLIPVVVLTSSQSEDDREACYQLHANAFMTKALHFDELQTMARVISDYWFKSVKLPPR